MLPSLHFLIHYMSIITTPDPKCGFGRSVTCSEDYLGVVYHMFFTMFLMLQNNPDFYKDFRSTAHDDQFTVGARQQRHV